MIKESHILNKHFSGFPFSEAGAPTVSIAPFPSLSSVSHFYYQQGLFPRVPFPGYIKAYTKHKWL